MRAALPGGSDAAPGQRYVGGRERLPPLDAIPRKAFCLLQSYDGLHRSTGEVFEPGSVEELRVLFDHARRAGRRVTFRAGAQSFDGQALNEDIVIAMSRFDAIEIDAEQRRVTAGAGATWGAVVAALACHGLIPYTVVSTSYATVGGTVAGDCLSRFSGTAGKEGRYVESLELLTMDGQLLTLTPSGPTSGLFRAVVGGLGYFGAVLRVTYRVARVGPAGCRIRLVTQVSGHASLEHLAASLLPDSETMAPREGPPPEGWLPEALFSIAYQTLQGSKSVVLRSRYSADGSLSPRRMLTHRPRHVLRVPIEWLLRASAISRGIWTLVDRFFFDFEHPYIDDLEDYLFFMDGNVRSKRVAQTFGMPMSTVQQAFMIPFDPAARGESLRRLVEFLTEVNQITTREEIPPTLLDVLFVRGDEFVLSASYGTDGFVVTLAFETSEEESLQRICLRLGELSARARELGGRVVLVKNVHARPSDLQAMYSHALPELVRLKRLVDPGCTLRNEFLERVFPDCFPRLRATGRPAARALPPTW